jgi:protein-L-isoaspartate O-methyltransferase
MELEPSHRVLELGTGTGYQTALLSTLASKITSIERFRTLHEKAGIRLENLGIENVILRLGDATNPNQAWDVFDRIIVQKIGKFLKVGSRFETSELMDIRTQPFLSGTSTTI